MSRRILTASGRARFAALAMCLALIAAAFFSLSSQASAATVRTGQTDYAAGDIAFITGSGWEPGEIVALEFTEAPLLHPADTLYTVAEVIADGAGNIYSGYVVPGHDVGQTFTLTATGQTSGLTVQTTFTNNLGSASTPVPLTTTLLETDKTSYIPGETVIITGSGWGLSETVALEIVEDPLIHPAE